MRVARVLMLAAVISSGQPLALGGPRMAAASSALLATRLGDLVRSFAGGAGIWVADPALAQPLFAADADREVVAASLYKLAILVEAERRVEAGASSYTDLVTIEPEDITDDGSFEAAGTTMALDDALEAMITVSDNGTALALWRLFGPANINATLARSGISGLHVALNDDEDNLATPRAVGTLFTLLARRELISGAASDRM
ncbi:MAG: class A beta-lactamase-related serine hydrolase, partial [Actinobacteria bacterium]|nr:class A beta-lactamase-related serine hydrolase [Actinomycetota bacterium]